MGKKTSSTESFYIVNAGTAAEAVLPVPERFEDTPSEQFEEIVVSERHIVLSVAERDDCPENPLTDWDGNGEIHWHPRARYAIKGFDSYLAHAARNEYGNPIIDEDKLQQIWRDKVMAVPLELFEPLVDDRYDDQDTAEKLRETLADESPADYGAKHLMEIAWSLTPDERAERSDALDAVDDAIGWQYELAVEQATEAPELWVVPLDCFEHGLMRLDVAGTGPSCYWDTSRNAALWVPDDAAFPELYRRAAVYAYGSIDDSITLASGAKYNAKLGHGAEAVSLGIFEDWGAAFTALETAAVAAGLPTLAYSQGRISYIVAEREFTSWTEACQYRSSLIPFGQLKRGIRAAAEEMAQQASELYTAYVNGDVWEHYTLQYKLKDGAKPNDPDSWELADSSEEDYSTHYGIASLEAERRGVAASFKTAIDPQSDTGHAQALELGVALANLKGTA
jgi:hypothetical protein